MTRAPSAFLDDDSTLRPSDAAAAILLGPDSQFLLQLRDDKPGIFFPAHWGCFGGAIERSDRSVAHALARELDEELGVALSPNALTRFMEVTFDLSFAGIGVLSRTYYVAHLSTAQVAALRLGEGSAFCLFPAREALSIPNVVPYDRSALWFYIARDRLAP
jgi:8-oxo-dGTP pyrophosphatase MutT (NUDIX family)